MFDIRHGQESSYQGLGTILLGLLPGVQEPTPAQAAAEAVIPLLPLQGGLLVPQVDLPGGPLVRLRDEWGELHYFPEHELVGRQTQASPFVSREMITGRALLVFWPFRPGLGVYRMKWIR